MSEESEVRFLPIKEKNLRSSCFFFHLFYIFVATTKTSRQQNYNKIMRIQIINGPNLNLLGVREPEIYGKRAWEDYLKELRARFPKVRIDYFQSNLEGEIINKIQEVGFDRDGIVINAGAYTHTSIAILDALKAVGIPAVEVHISDISTRESFRQISYPGMACIKSFVGLGFDGYRRAILFLKDYLLRNNPEISS